jgi:hypothetical protein
MPELSDLLGAALGGDIQRQLGDRIGASPEATQNAIQAALPMLLSGLASNASQPGGAASLHAALERDHDGSLLDDLGGLLGGRAGGRATDGGGILGHVLGERQAVTQRAVGQASGLNSAQVMQLMVTLAPVLMSALGRTQRARGLDADGLASMLRGERDTVARQQPGLMGLANQLLDRNRDGSALDDLIQGLGGMLGKRG